MQVLFANCTLAVFPLNLRRPHMVLSIQCVACNKYSAHAIHQTVQNYVKVNALPTVHELSDNPSHFMPAETHVHNVVNDLLQGDSVGLSLAPTLQNNTHIRGRTFAS